MAKLNWRLKSLKSSGTSRKRKSVEGISTKRLENNEIRNKLNKIKKMEGKLDRNYLKYETDK